MAHQSKKTKIFPDNQEFALIESLFDPEHFSRDARLPGDDGQILEIGNEVWTVSSDISLEKTHFRLDWCTISQALEKAILSNLSDINAMGARCSYIYLNMGIPKSWKKQDFKNIGPTIKKMEKKYQFQVGGGDISRTIGPCFFSITVIGKIIGAPLLRSNAVPGQGIYVSGFLGDASAGLQILSGKKLFSLFNKLSPYQMEQHLNYLVKSYHRPKPNLKLGPYLSGLRGKIAAIDISDGLSSELWHLARQSRCKMVIDLECLPSSSHLSVLYGKSQRMHHHMLHGGETYNLLFSATLNKEELNSLKQYGRVYKIGTVQSGEGVFISAEGRDLELKPKGWSH